VCEGYTLDWLQPRIFVTTGYFLFVAEHKVTPKCGVWAVKAVHFRTVLCIGRTDVIDLQNVLNEFLLTDWSRVTSWTVLYSMSFWQVVWNMKWGLASFLYCDVATGFQLHFHQAFSIWKKSTKTFSLNQKTPSLQMLKLLENVTPGILRYRQTNKIVNKLRLSLG